MSLEYHVDVTILFVDLLPARKFQKSRRVSGFDRTKYNLLSLSLHLVSAVFRVRHQHHAVHQLHLRLQGHDRLHLLPEGAFSSSSSSSPSPPVPDQHTAHKNRRRCCVNLPELYYLQSTCGASKVQCAVCWSGFFFFFCVECGKL